MKKHYPICLALILVFNLAIFSFGQQGNAATSHKYFVYVANSGGDGTISAYSFNPSTGVLTEIKGSPFPAEIFSSNLVIHPNKKFVYVINYESQNISVYTINALTGALSPIKGSPFVPVSSFGLINIAPSGKFLYTANSDGNLDIYAVNTTTGVLTPVKSSPFKIPKNISDISLDQTGKLALIAYNKRNSVIAYSVNNKTGILSKMKETPIKSDKNPSSITLDPTGKFALVSNYDSKTISTYSINTITGGLTEIKSSSLRVGEAFQVVFATSEKFVYILSRNNISVYSFNSTTGKLTEIKDGSYDFPDINSITSITIEPNDKFLYATNKKDNLIPNSSNTIYAYSIDPNTGKLTEIKGSPFKAGDKPSSIITVKK
jgi:6-phosphogluconolactonase